MNKGEIIMEDKKINILFVCGMGMGTSTMAELGAKKALANLNIKADLQHTSLGMMESLRDWADVIVILKNLYSRITPKEGEFIIPVVNIMDSKGLASQIEKIVDEHFPEVKQ